MKKTHTLKAYILFALLLSTAQSSFATIQSAEEVVMETADQVLARLTSEKDLIEADPSRIYGLVNEIVIPHFDFISMSKWVLGKTNWRGASEAQRNSFIEQFKTLLVRTYAKALLEYSNEEIEYLPTENNPNSTLVVVKTKIKQAGSSAVPIDYRMHVSQGEWKVVDIVVDKVSLVMTYQGSFNSEIRKNGLDGLITKLTQRNETMVSSSSN